MICPKIKSHKNPSEIFSLKTIEIYPEFVVKIQCSCCSHIYLLELKDNLHLYNHIKKHYAYTK